MKLKQCMACDQNFLPCPQVPNQCFCSALACQKERRRRWQRDKLKTDPAYQDNQNRAQQAWLQRNPGYWSQYREKHPDYLELNRIKQQTRNRLQENKKIAKMNASFPALPMQSGVYVLSNPRDLEVAKMDAWIVEIRFISRVEDVPH
jgi:hypothetical protein